MKHRRRKISSNFVLDRKKMVSRYFWGESIGQNYTKIWTKTSLTPGYTYITILNIKQNKKRKPVFKSMRDIMHLRHFTRFTFTDFEDEQKKIKRRILKNGKDTIHKSSMRRANGVRCSLKALQTWEHWSISSEIVSSPLFAPFRLRLCDNLFECKMFLKEK